MYEGQGAYTAPPLLKNSFVHLDGYDGEDKVEEKVHDQDIEHILQRVDNTVEHGLNKPKSEISDRI